jgi:hypothetical protein
VARQEEVDKLQIRMDELLGGDGVASEITYSVARGGRLQYQILPQEGGG